MRSYSPKLVSLSLLTLGLLQFNGTAQNTNMPSDFGAVVNGFQDNFTNATRDPAWIVSGAGGDKYFQTNGVLSVGTMFAGNPNHLLYIPAGGYDGTTQEVLIRIRIINMPFVPQGSAHAGEVVAAEPPGGENLPEGSGVNWQLMNTSDDGSLYGDDINGPQARSLYDYVAWGPGYTNNDIPWQTYTWYWMREHLDGLSTQGQTYSNMWAKVWLADGSEAEPTNWQYMDAYDLTVADGSGVTNGVAGITAGTSGAGDDFEVDFFLLKAAGLPSITVNPLFDPLYLNEQPTNVTSAVGATASFSVTAISTGTAPTYQWQSAPSGSSTFGDISGANSSTYTTPTLTSGQNGNAYRVVVTSASPSAQVISTNATVTLEAPPTLLYAKTLGQPNQLTLVFDVPIFVPSGVSGFAINNGATVTGLAQGDNAYALVLTTTGVTLGGSYTVTINGVQSVAGAPLAANTQANIDFTVEVPAEFGQVVNGFQEDFNEANLSTNWYPVPTNDMPWFQSSGMLHMSSITSLAGYQFNPVHLFYEPQSGYSSDSQEVLVRMRITQPAYADAFVLARCGDSVGADPLDGGDAANLLMMDPSDPTVFGTAGQISQILVDYVAWGGIIDDPGTTNTFFWKADTWYWLRLMMTTATPQNGSNNIFAKIWQGDGSTPEPAEWQSSLSVTMSTGNALFAGLVAPSQGYPESYDVDYFLLKTPDLPPITVAPAVYQVPDTIFLSITNEPASEFVPGGQTATLTTGAVGSGPVTLQWQVAAAGSSNFANISGATNDVLTIPDIQGAENGNQYQAVFTLAGGAIVKTSVVAVVTTDVTPPALIFARTGGSNGQVIVQFSKPIPTPSTTNFSINHGVTISGIVPGVTSNEVILAVSPLSLSTNYTLTATDISDNYGNILASGQVQVDFTVYLPPEFGTTVNGFQDDFTEATMNTNWVIYTADGGGALNVPPPADMSGVFDQTNGNLYVGYPPSGDDYNPVHLVYVPTGGCNSSNQQVLARIMVTSFLPSGSALAGVCVCAQLNNARGINWMMTDNSVTGSSPALGPDATLLDDYTAWGPGAGYPWLMNTWYWMRLSQVASSTPGNAIAYAKIWPADGATPEPSAWQEAWAYTDGGTLERGSGFPAFSGITTSDSEGLATFQVSYVLIQAAGLPSVKVSPGNLFPFTYPTLSVSEVSPGSLTLQWNGSATLQTAQALSGPWTDVIATSPYIVNTTTGNGAFFRLKQ